MPVLLFTHKGARCPGVTARRLMQSTVDTRRLERGGGLSHRCIPAFTADLDGALLLLRIARWGGLESEAMQPGRPFLRSLQATFLRHIKGKVHADNGSFRSRRRLQRCVRAEGSNSDPRAAPLERSEVVSRVLAAVKSCSGVDSSKVTEYANFEEDLGLEKGDVVVLVLAILKKYDLSLSYVEARRTTTCVEVIDYIESQVCQECSSSSEDP